MNAGIEALGGRCAALKLWPLSLSENPGTRIPPVIYRRRLADWLLTGGFPALHDRPDVDPRSWFSSFLETYLERDVGTLARVSNLRGFEDLPTKVLSQGQKRRVGLARLLINKAKLWVLDEPFNALDKAAVGLLQSVIRDHVAEGGMVLLTTHQEVSLTQGEVRNLQLGVGEKGHV